MSTRLACCGRWASRRSRSDRSVAPKSVRADAPPSPVRPIDLNVGPPTTEALAPREDGSIQSLDGLAP